MSLSNNLTLNQFKSLYPNCRDPKSWFSAMDSVFKKTSINSIKRQAAFIAQCGHESGGWRVFSENLNYSSTALNQVFPKYFKNAGRNADEYHRQPEKIANVVYADRMGNGNTASGDGWKYRGRGPIQLTGKNNYVSFQKFIDSSAELHGNFIGIDIVKNPDLVSENEQLAILSAIHFWQSNNLNFYCDSYDIKTLTKRINGGYNGLSDRTSHYIDALYAMIGILKIGNKGEEVMCLQELLEISADGDFGPNTQKILISYQKNHNLTSDGICGFKTIQSFIL